MEDFSQTGRNSHFRFRMPVSLRTRLIAGNILITVISISALGYYMYVRGQDTSKFLSDELDASIQQKAVDTLTATGDSQTMSLNAFFASVHKDISYVGSTTGSLLSHELQLGTTSFWDATDSLSRLSNDSWDNPSSTEAASVFIPAHADLTSQLAMEINALRQLDFVAPAVLKGNPDAVALYFGGPTGETVYYPNIDLASLVPSDFDVTQRPWYQAAAPEKDPRHQAAWSVPYLDAANHGLILTASSPVYDDSGAFRGVVAIDIQLNRLSALVSNIHVGETGYAFLIDGDGRLIAMPDAGYRDLGYSPGAVPLGQSLGDEGLPQPLPPALAPILNRMKAGESGIETIKLADADRYVIFRPIAEVGYSLGMLVPKSEVLAGSEAAKQQLSMSATNTQQISFVLVAMILGFALLATLGIGNTLIAPLLALTATAEEITAGNLEARARLQGRDEIATLAGALNAMTARLRDLIQSLERRVGDRTAALEAASVSAGRRAAQFEAITEVTRAISSIRNMDELMPVVAAVISQFFEFYHVGIFLNDENKEFAWLIATNSEGGHRMLERHHRLKIGAQGIVGYVAGRGESRVARSVGEDAVFFNNPDLPDTKSEAALPLRRGSEIAGVLDVQSTREDAFSDEDLSILAILADQVSLAMENTRLFETTRRSLMEAETVYRQYIQEAWSRSPKQDDFTGYRYTPRGAVPLSAAANPSAADDAAHDLSNPPMVTPIKLRGEVIGNLIVRAQKPGSWRQDQIELIQAVAERVALAAENARLFEETSRRAERERLVTEITSHIRSTNDPDEMIRTALDELRNALGATDIQLIPQVVPGPSQTKPEQLTSTAPARTKRSERGNGADR